MDLLIKAAAVGIIGALLNIVVKKSSPEMALALTLAVGVLVLTMAMELLSGVREVMDYAKSLTGMSAEVVTPVLKCVGIGIITRISSDICKDAGASAIASSVELVGAASALLVAMPLVGALIHIIGGLL